MHAVEIRIAALSLNDRALFSIFRGSMDGDMYQVCIKLPEIPITSKLESLYQIRAMFYNSLRVFCGCVFLDTIVTVQPVFLGQVGQRPGAASALEYGMKQDIALFVMCTARMTVRIRDKLDRCVAGDYPSIVTGVGGQTLEGFPDGA